MDPGGMRPFQVHPRLVLRRRRANGGHVPAQPRRPGRSARDGPGGAGDNQMLPAGGPGQQRRRPGSGPLGRQPRPDPGRPAAGAGHRAPGPGGRAPGAPAWRAYARHARHRLHAVMRHSPVSAGPAWNAAGAGPRRLLARLRHDPASAVSRRRGPASPGAGRRASGTTMRSAREGGKQMTTRITDSPLYQHLWGTAESRAVLGEGGRLRGWLEVIVALARAQAAAGVIPADAAALIAEHARADRIDLGYAAEQTRQTSHSMLGLIRALQAALPGPAREYVYTGTTVQDITDTWTSLAIRRIGSIVWRDLRQIEERLLDLAVAHRSTVMAGRTHGQPGSPVTFGWKAACWADEVRRHLNRL